MITRVAKENNTKPGCSDGDGSIPALPYIYMWGALTPMYLLILGVYLGYTVVDMPLEVTDIVAAAEEEGLISPEAVGVGHWRFGNP